MGAHLNAFQDSFLLDTDVRSARTQKLTDVSALSSAQRDSSFNIPTELSKDVEPDLTANAHERILTELAHGTKRRPTSELATLTSPVLMLLWWNKLIFASCVSAELIHENCRKLPQRFS